MDLAVSRTVLANGLQVVSAGMPHVDSMAMGIWTRVGGRCEPARLAGVSHFIEHLLFKGSATRSAQDITREIEGRGGYCNAFTQEDSTCYYAKVTPETSMEVLDILVDMVRRPRFRPEDIELERAVILDEIAMYKDDASQYVDDLLGEILWARHPLGRSLTGDRRSVSGLSRTDLTRFHRHWYRPGNTVAAFAGPLPHAEVVREARRLMGRWQPSPCPSVQPVRASTPQQSFAWAGREVEQTHLALGVRLFGRHDKRRFTLKLLSVLLGENMSSRLFQMLREREGMAYSVQSAIYLFEDSGSLVINGGLDSRRLERALRLIGRELRRLRDRKVSRAELKLAKDYAVGQLRTGLETSTSRMNWLGENLMGLGCLVQPGEVVEQLAAVSAEDIQQVARAILKPARYSLALVGPRDCPHDKKLLRLLG